MNKTQKAAVARRQREAAQEKRAALETAQKRQRWRSFIVWPLLIVGFVVALPVFLVLLVRIERPGYQGSPDSAIDKAWAFAFLAGLLVWLLALLGGASVGIWWLLE